MDATAKTTAYPVVFLHGLGGWGEDDGLDRRFRYHYWGFDARERDLAAYLRQQGREVFCPSLGPFTSAWDRACELYAYLYGGTVDFGQRHSERHGHQRYGRRYPGVLRDLGQPGPHEKIELIGHSFGGPTAIVFADLLANGSPEERAETPEGQLSPLFAGGHDAVHSVVTLSGANNGTTFADFFGDRGIRVLAGVIYGANALAAGTPLMDLLDFHTDQWEIMGDRSSGSRSVPPLKNRLRGAKQLVGNRLDNVGFELQVEYAALLYRHLSLSPDTRYLAYRACRTHDDGKGRQLPNRDMRRILKLWSTVIGRYRPQKLSAFGFDESWLPSDGIVNVRCLGAPFNVPARNYAPGEAIAPGVWYHMPVEDKHHMSWVGIGETEEAFFTFFDGLLALLDAPCPAEEKK